MVPIPSSLASLSSTLRSSGSNLPDKTDALHIVSSGSGFVKQRLGAALGKLGRD
ncbi:MAG: hypothetical protein ABSH05_23055 [Bryobacteraceae bacterium]